MRQWPDRTPSHLPPEVDEQAQTFETDDGVTLEALVHVPAAPKGRVAICHPNPPQGGTMHNKVVEIMQRVLARCELCTVRFNFRGVGTSTGMHTGGEAEPLDVAAALEHADRVFAEALARAGDATDPNAGAPRLRVLAGFSFGSAMAAQALHDGAEVDGLLLVGLPLDMRDLAPPPLPRLRLDLIVGDHDEYCPLGKARRFIGDYQDVRARLRVIDDAGHFFHGRLAPLARAVYDFVMQS